MCRAAELAMLANNEMRQEKYQGLLRNADSIVYEMSKIPLESFKQCSSRSR